MTEPCATLPELPSCAEVQVRNQGRLQRVIYAIAMDPDRFASMEEQILLLTKAFQERGGVFLPLFICGHRQGNPAVYESAGLRAVCLDLHHFRLNTLQRLISLIRQNRIEVIHWSFTGPLTNPYLWAVSILCPRVKHFFTDHTSRLMPLAEPASGLKRAMKGLLYQRYTKIFGVSRFVENHLREHGCSGNLSTRPYFLNTNRFRPDPSTRAAVRSQYNATDDFIVIVVAYLVPFKGVDVAISSLTHLPQDVKLWIIGGGEELGRLQTQAEGSGLTGRVRFFGHQPDVEKYMQAADCFVCPSRWGEAAGIVNLEAQSSGLPALGSRVGGIPEYIQDGKTGFLFESENDLQLADAIRLLYDHPERHQEMRQEARAWVVQGFSHEKRIEDFLDLYRST